jgi:hypothetical protein
VLTKPAAGVRALSGIVAWDELGATKQGPAGVAAGEGCARREGHVRFGLGEAKRRDDLAANPGGVGFVGDGFYDEAEQGEAVVRVFEPGVAVENGRLGQVGEELGLIEEGAKACELVAGATVAREAGGVRHDLGKRGLGDVVV